MKYVYTAIFNPEQDGINVSFPDLKGCLTFGENIENALLMSKDALCLFLYDMEQAGEEIPPATPPQNVKTKGNDFISMINVDTDYYKRYYENKSVKKTLTIPAWLNREAEEANVNFSAILQKGLKSELNIE